MHGQRACWFSVKLGKFVCLFHGNPSKNYLWCYKNFVKGALRNWEHCPGKILNLWLFLLLFHISLRSLPKIFEVFFLGSWGLLWIFTHGVFMLFSSVLWKDIAGIYNKVYGQRIHQTKQGDILVQLTQGWLCWLRRAFQEWVTEAVGVSFLP